MSCENISVTCCSLFWEHKGKSLSSVAKEVLIWSPLQEPPKFLFFLLIKILREGKADGHEFLSEKATSFFQSVLLKLGGGKGVAEILLNLGSRAGPPGPGYLP